PARSSIPSLHDALPISTTQVERTLDDCLAAVTANYPGLAAGSRIHEGPPAKILAEISQTADTVVVGSRGRGGFAGLVLGSASQGDRKSTRLNSSHVSIS